MRKYLRSGAYVIIMIIIIVIAMVIFKNIGSIKNAIKLTSVYNDIQPQFFSLYIYLVIALGVPFLFLITLLFIDFFNKSVAVKKHEEVSQENNTESAEEKDEEISSEEKEKKLTEERIKIYKEKNLAMNNCLKEQITKKSNDPKLISEKILSCISKFYEIVQGEIFLIQNKDKKNILAMSAAYAYFIPEEKVFEFEIGEGLIGQVAKEKTTLNLTDVPEGYIKVASGLGSATPSNLIIIPLLNSKEEVVGVIELASFKSFNEDDKKLLEDIAKNIHQFYQKNDNK